MSGLERNPFFVLELPVTAGPREVEREAARLLGMLELGLAAAATYPTPLGPRPRRPEDVRAAAAALREPKKRLVAELWAAIGPGSDAAPDTASVSASGSASASGWGSGAAAGSASGSGSVSGAGTRTHSGDARGPRSEAQDPATAEAEADAWPDAMAAAGWGRR